jgi:cytochrome c oxidase subunit 2
VEFAGIMIEHVMQLGGTLGDFWAPPLSSQEGGDIDFVLKLIAWISAFFFALIVGLMLWMIVRFRQRRKGEIGRSQVSHSTALELAWTIPPIILVIVIFWFSFVAFLRISTPKANALEVDVLAQKWFWRFDYALPDGGTYQSNELHLVADRPVQLNMTSADVIHSLFVPAFRVKKDTVPGRYNKMWFRPTRAGEYPLLCTEYCGTKHSQMIAKVVVHPTQGDFDQWLAESSRAIVEDLPDELYAMWRNANTQAEFDKFLEAVKQAMPEIDPADLAKLVKPAIAGQQLYERLGCQQCHSLDGSRMTGPSFKGIWGEKAVFADGSEAVVDANYIRESILEPQSKIVATYQGVMPSYKGQISDRQVDAMVAFIRSLGEETP